MDVAGSYSGPKLYSVKRSQEYEGIDALSPRTHCVLDRSLTLWSGVCFERSTSMLLKQKVRTTATRGGGLYPSKCDRGRRSTRMNINNGPFITLINLTKYPCVGNGYRWRFRAKASLLLKVIHVNSSSRQSVRHQSIRRSGVCCMYSPSRS